MNFEIHFNRKRALFMLAVAVLYSLYLFYTGAESLQLKLILPIALLFFSLPRIHKKHLVFKEKKLTVHAQFGPIKRNYTFNKLSDFQIESGKLYLNTKLKRQLITEAWVVNKEEWSALFERIKPRVDSSF